MVSIEFSTQRYRKKVYMVTKNTHGGGGGNKIYMIFQICKKKLEKVKKIHVVVVWSFFWEN